MLIVTSMLAAGSSAAAQEKMYFPAIDNVRAVLIKHIRAETVRIDMSAWYLTDGELVNALILRHQQGIPIRLIGDRGATFEIDPHTKSAFYRLANAGVPIRLRVNPTWYPEIVHWKTMIFVGQNLVEFGSANFTPFELAPVSATSYKDETALLTNDPVLVNAFKTQFDRMWNDTTREPRSLIAQPYFMNWAAACAREAACSDFATLYPNPAPMHINTARLEPDHVLPPEMVWGQGAVFNDRLIQEINTETNFVNFVMYRLTVPNIADALIAKHKSGVPVRIIMEPLEYINRKWPEFWLTHAYVDKLWAAGIPIKKRIHQGLTHMKMLVTSRHATNASSNFAAAWQRDTNYFVPAGGKPAVYGAMRDRFNIMWNDTAGFADFVPTGPDTPALSSPASAATGVSTTPTLTWQRATFAVSYDIFLGTSSANMTRVANVPAQLVNNPPATYSWKPTTALQPGTTYSWRVVSRTFASLTAQSATRTFTTSGTATTPPPPPPPTSSSGPFTGTAISLPGTVEAENFDNGAAGVAYRDTSPGNSGAQYRTTDVDIQATSDTGGGYNVGWTAPTEWLAYTVDVRTAGTYQLRLRVAASGAGGRVHVEFNGADKTGPMTIPNTGGWQVWNTISAPVTLAAGPQTMRLVVDAASAAGVVGNINRIEVVASSTTSPPPTSSTPFSGTAVALPGTVQAENFDNGGAGVAYHDTSSGNSGGQYRSTDVDIEASSDGGAGFNVGWMAAAEWLTYTVSVANAGTYQLSLRVAASGAGGRLHVEFDGVDKTGPMTIPNTGGWQTWSTISAPVTLGAGTQKMRVVVDAASAAGVVGNLNRIEVAPTSTTAQADSTPFAGTAIALPGTVQAENFDNGGAGVAYRDLSAGNTGGEYRSTDVDIQATSDAGGGYNVGWMAAGEWLVYTVSLPTTGTYQLNLRVAAAGAGGRLHVEFDGDDETGGITIPNTGGWQAWTTISTPVTLSAGTHEMRLVVDAAGAGGIVGNVNAITVVRQ